MLVLVICHYDIYLTEAGAMHEAGYSFRRTPVPLFNNSSIHIREVGLH